MLLKYGLNIAILIFVATSGCTDASSNDLGKRRQHIKHKDSKVSKEAQSRKERSIEILKNESVPYIDHLPVIEIEIESTRRTPKEVALRAIALCLVALKGEGLEQEMIEKLINQYDISSEFTPKEKEFIENPNPSQHDRIQFAWRYECYWVMLWALGYIEKLDSPDKICDVQKAVLILKENGRNDFVKKAELRSQSEILNAADLIYRYHWAVVDAKTNDLGIPAGLESGVVMERHHALNWLIGYMDQDWDDISTDT